MKASLIKKADPEVAPKTSPILGEPISSLSNSHWQLTYALLDNKLTLFVNFQQKGKYGL